MSLAVELVRSHFQCVANTLKEFKLLYHGDEEHTDRIYYLFYDAAVQAGSRVDDMSHSDSYREIGVIIGETYGKFRITNSTGRVSKWKPQ